jgi:hypothetical protein
MARSHHKWYQSCDESRKLYYGANRETIDAMKLLARDHGNDRAEGEER